MVDLIAHFIFSIVIGFTLWKLFDGTKKKVLLWCLGIALLSGFFVDLDHFYDYIKNYGLVWDFQHFITEDYFTVTNYVFLHGFEYVFILGVIACFVEDKAKRLYLIVAATSLFAHLWVDIILGNVPVQEYFFIYRLLHGFKTP